MYNDYYGFSESPFENNLDQRFLYFSANHRDVATGLVNFIKWEKEFALVCGDGGTGKTLLIRYLLSRLPDSVHPIMTANPDAGYVNILQSVARILKIDDPGQCEPDLAADHVNSALVAACRQGERFVLIVDNAHLFSDKSLEQIRLLSNIETPEHKLFQILFVGRCALSRRLNRPELRQIRQRISINRFLTPMNAVETIQYIDHRLNRVGADFGACFEADCRNSIFKMTNGVPRSINQLCDSALRVCMTEKLLKVNRKVLKQARTALQSAARFIPGSHAGSTVFSLKKIRLPAVFGATAALILLGIYGYQGRLGDGVRYFLHGPEPTRLAPPAAVQQPVSETVANPEMPPAAVNPDAVYASKSLDPATGAASEIAGSGKAPPSAGAPLPELKHLLSTEALEYIAEKTGSVVLSPQFLVKGLRPEKPASRLPRPKSVVVKKGDTLIRIAFRFFPENKADGVKKILAANPKLDDTSRINIGQKLIIPGTGSNGKNPD